MNEIINNHKISNNITDIYKFLNDNKNVMNRVFDSISEDLKEIFDTVVTEDSKIKIKIPKSAGTKTKSIILDCIQNNIIKEFGTNTLINETILFIIFESNEYMIITKKY